MGHTIAIIGTGKVGTELARALTRAGYPVLVGSRDPGGTSAHALAASVPDARVDTIAGAVAKADVVILAVPWRAVPGALAAADEGLAGTILVDATNPLVWEEDEAFHVASPSGGELVQELAPDARVVKAFNTIGYEQMSDPVFGDHNADLLLAGDDPSAKAVVSELGAAIGLRPLDAGPLRHAGIMERLAMLWLALASAGMGRDMTFKVLER